MKERARRLLRIATASWHGGDGPRSSAAGGGSWGARPPRLEPEDFYFDDDGRMVFTRVYHLKRGHCCESGCRHCPWGYAEKLQEAPEQ